MHHFSGVRGSIRRLAQVARRLLVTRDVQRDKITREHGNEKQKRRLPREHESRSQKNASIKRKRSLSKRSRGPKNRVKKAIGALALVGTISRVAHPSPGQRRAHEHRPHRALYSRENKQQHNNNKKKVIMKNRREGGSFGKPGGVRHLRAESRPAKEKFQRDRGGNLMGAEQSWQEAEKGNRDDQSRTTLTRHREKSASFVRAG